MGATHSNVCRAHSLFYHPSIPNYSLLELRQMHRRVLNLTGVLVARVLKLP
jgi:hypothetical protein